MNFCKRLKSKKILVNITEINKFPSRMTLIKVIHGNLIMFKNTMNTSTLKMNRISTFKDKILSQNKITERFFQNLKNFKLKADISHH